MSPHLIFCADCARRDPSTEKITRIEGWCIASSPIEALYLQHSDIGQERLPHGFDRVDVGRAYPGHARAAHSGFRLTTTSHTLDGPADLLAKFADGLHRLRVNLDTRDIQTIPLTNETLLTEDTGTFDVEEEFRRSLGKTPGLTLRLDLINKCNLRCVMCHFSDDAIFRRPTRQLTADQFKNLFDDLGPSVREVMLSCGDEPLLSKHLTEILRYLAREHPHVAVGFCTNATLMNAAVRNVIMETGVARLLFSIDAVSKSLLESIRVGCRYEQVVGNIMALRDLRHQLGATRPTFVFNFVMMTRNIHEAPDFVRMAHELGAAAIDFRHVVPIATYFSPDDLLSEQPGRYNYYREKILAAANATALSIYLPPPFPNAPEWSPLDEPKAHWEDFARTQPDPNGDAPILAISSRNFPIPSWEGSVSEEFATTFCNRPFSEIMLRDQDEVLPCPFQEKPLGRLSEGKTLAEIFRGEAFQRLRRNMLRPEGDPACANCPIKAQQLSGDTA